MKNIMPKLKAASPTILSCISAVGVVATAVLAVKATPKSLKLCEALRLERVNDYQEEPTKMDYIREAWKCYIPAATVGICTIACIFGANGFNKRRQAAILSAYALLDQSFKEYKSKVSELYGDDSNNKIQNEIAKERYKNFNKSTNDETLIFYEEHYGKLFERTMLQVKTAEYELNRKLALEGEVNLNYFFELLGLEKTEAGDILGWSMDSSFVFYSYPWIDFGHETVEMDDGMECNIINILTAPLTNFNYPF